MLTTGTCRIQKTANQVIVEVWNGERKLSIYIDAGRNEADIYRVEGEECTPAGTDIVGSLQWLAETRSTELFNQ